jgi:predicted regulator of Ras-like GTPase activity (Roadblock/LC7/MglB family)
VIEIAPDEDPRDSLQYELRAVVDDCIGVAGALVATTEGLLIASEFDATASVPTQAEAEIIAAMAAATAGLGDQFANRLTLGSSSGCVVQGSRGCIAVQRVGDTGVLVLFGSDGLNVARLYLAVRQALPRIHEVLRGMGV